MLPAAPQLSAGGAPLPGALQDSLSPLFGTGFGDVRLHDDVSSHTAAQTVGARAFTLGQHIHFASGEFRPHEPEGRALLAHELTHTVQQRGATDDPHAPITVGAHDTPWEHEANRVAEQVARGSAVPNVTRGSMGGAQRVAQRVGIIEFFARLFFEGTFSDKELLDYLTYLDKHEAIEGSYDSDNKARAIIRRWRAGDKLFHPTLRQKQLMLLEMIDGPTLDDDEHAILELLRGSSDSEVVALIGAAGGEAALKSEFHGSESDELDAFLDAWHAKKSHRPVSERELEQHKAPIAEIVVNQDTPQVVTVKYADGRIESNTCSTGKGTCCVDPGDSGGPTVADTNTSDSNWTPIGTHVVQFKVPDHKGIHWWTQFNSRAIALHEYAPVDGTPLSHGCVRLNADFARRIYEGAQEKRTKVIVTGTPRPRCDHGALKAEWDNDFSMGSGTPRDGEERELRQHLKLAFGTSSDRVVVQKISEGKIPRCRGGRAASGRP